MLTLIFQQFTVTIFSYKDLHHKHYYTVPVVTLTAKQPPVYI